MDQQLDIFDTRCFCFFPTSLPLTLEPGTLPVPVGTWCRCWSTEDGLDASSCEVGFEELVVSGWVKFSFRARMHYEVFVRRWEVGTGVGIITDELLRTRRRESPGTERRGGGAGNN